MAGVTELFFTREDYETICSMTHYNLPEAYDDWLKGHLDRLEAARRRGDEVAIAPIKPDKFARYASELEYRTDLDRALWDAVHKILG